MSSDLYHWDVCGEEISFNSHEGPNVFEFGGSRWMITDEWNGLGVYKTEDFTNWERNGVILRDGGSRPCDGVMANHADVVVSGENAYRACIQVAKLDTDGKTLTCDRDAEFELVLLPGESN